MAKVDPVEYTRQSLEYVERLEELTPEIPDRPFLLKDDFPAPGTDGAIASFQEAQWQTARAEREYQARQGMSGYLAQGWQREPGAPTPAERYEQGEREQELRAIRCGLPDSPEDMPAKATSSKPFKGLRSR